MNAQDVLTYGHYTVLSAVEDLPEEDWHTPGVCGVWSVKDIIAHLASFEHMLVDLLTSFVSDDAATPTLDAFRDSMEAFNDDEVAKRRRQSADETLAEYVETYEKTAQLLAQIPDEVRRQNGTLPWYGNEYDLEDFIVYSFYGHKREHCAQIAVYRDTLQKRSEEGLKQ